MSTTKSNQLIDEFLPYEIIHHIMEYLTSELCILICRVSKQWMRSFKMLKLNLQFENTSFNVLSHICSSQLFSNLHSLSLDQSSKSDLCNMIGIEGAKTIAESEFLSNLTKLKLRNCNFGNEGHRLYPLLSQRLKLLRHLAVA